MQPLSFILDYSKWQTLPKITVCVSQKTANYGTSLLRFCTASATQGKAEGKNRMETKLFQYTVNEKQSKLESKYVC